MVTKEEKRAGRPALVLIGNSFPVCVARATRKYMAAGELSSSTVAAKMGMTITTFYRLYNGGSAESAGSHIDKLAALFDVSPSQLLSDGVEQDASVKQKKGRSGKNRG